MNPTSIHCNHVSHLADKLLGLGFRHGEFYNFEPAQVPTVKQFIDEHDITASVHCPLRKAPWFPHPVTWSFLTNDGESERRRLSLRMIEEALQDAADIGATYMVVHYPNPEASAGTDNGPDSAERLAWDSARLLNEWSARFNVPIHIEGFAPSPFMTPGFLCRVLDELPNLSYCFDTGHTFLAAQRGDLDFWEFLDRLAPRIGSVHVWNTRGAADYERYHHMPVHPALSPRDGWIDIERVVGRVAAANPCAVFVMEFVKDFAPEWKLDYREGIEWFKGLVSSAAGRDGCDKNIVLTGFMGTGKTRVGHEVARRMGREFVDMDAILEERSGLSVAEIFGRLGEERFRRDEAALCHELGSRQGLVIATGGGALVAEENRLAFAPSSLIFCLQAAPAEILRRLEGAIDRPMLEGGLSREKRVAELLERRRKAYAAIPYQIDTTHLTLRQVVDIVVDVYRRETRRDQPACRKRP